MPEELKQQVAVLDGKVDTLVDLVRGVHKTTRHTSERVKAVETGQKNIAEEVATLNKAIYLGNGQPPVMQRLTLLEVAVAGLTVNLKETATELTADLKTATAELEAVKTSKLLSRNQIIIGVLGMITTGLLALGGILAQLFR